MLDFVVKGFLVLLAAFLLLVLGVGPYTRTDELIGSMESKTVVEAEVLRTVYQPLVIILRLPGALLGVDSL